jgi:hypothetical protein
VTAVCVVGGCCCCAQVREVLAAYSPVGIRVLIPKRVAFVDLPTVAIAERVMTDFGAVSVSLCRCVCVSLCLSVCVLACLRACVLACLCACVLVCLCACMRLCTCVSVRVYLCVFVSVSLSSHALCLCPCAWSSCAEGSAGVPHGAQLFIGGEPVVLDYVSMGRGMPRTDWLCEMVRVRWWSVCVCASVVCVVCVVCVRVRVCTGRLNL